MPTQICRPFITLRNGKVLYAAHYGLQAFCFEVAEVRAKKEKSPKLEDDSKNKV